MLAVLFLYLLTWTWCRFPVKTALGVALAILRRFNLNEGDSIPTRMLSYLNMTLTASYPPQSSTIDTASELIKVFHRMIISVPVSLLEPVVFAVQSGLGVWIEDNCVSLSVDQYNNLVRNLSSLPPCLPLSLLFSQLMPVYDSILTRLQSLPLSLMSLNALTPLLTAVFSRILPPALGPTAFIRFFEVAHARLAASPNAYSDDLRVCIDAYVRAHGGEWPSGMPLLSSTSQTQSQFQMDGQLTMEVPVSPAVWRVAGEHGPHLHSIEVIIRVPHPWTFVEADLLWNLSTKLSQTPNVLSHTRCWVPHHIQDLYQGLFKDPQVQVTNHRSLSVRMISQL
jgi:hypothetical protein